MANADQFTRSYVFEDIHQPPTGSVVAELLERAAATLYGHGEIIVHHLAFDTSDHSAVATTSLTVYYDRVERRREP